MGGGDILPGFTWYRHLNRLWSMDKAQSREEFVLAHCTKENIQKQALMTLLFWR